MLIRQALEEDKEQLCAIYSVLFREMSQLQPQYYQAAADFSSYVEEIMQSPMTSCFVAQDDEKILGFAVVVEQNSPSYTCIRQMKFAYLLDMAVAPEQRGRGIGGKLIEAVKVWGEEQKFHHIALAVLEENEQAIAFYEKNSFKTAMRTMRLEL